MVHYLPHFIYMQYFVYIQRATLFFAIESNWNVWTRETGECRHNEYQTSFVLKSMRVSLNLLFVAKRIYLTFIRFNHLEFDSDWVARIFTTHLRFNTHTPMQAYRPCHIAHIGHNTNFTRLCLVYQIVLFQFKVRMEREKNRGGTKTTRAMCIGSKLHILP